MPFRPTDKDGHNKSFSKGKKHDTAIAERISEHGVIVD